MSNEDKLQLALIFSFPAMVIIDLIYWRIFQPNRKRAYFRIRSKGISALKKMSWQDFERFCGLHYERQGYKVRMCGLGGADGGLDLLLKKHGKTTMVQCKHWKGKVSVTTVREMYGVMCANSYDAVIIVALTGFTREAKQWAAGKPISLVSGADILK